MNLKKIVRRVLGDDRADKLSARLRLGIVEPNEVQVAMVEAIRNMPELIVSDERPGRRSDGIE